MLLPALANCVEIGGTRSSMANSGMAHLPTIQRLILLAKSWPVKMVCMYRPKPPEVASRNLHCHSNSHNQKTVQIFPNVMEAAELTGGNLFISGKK